ncbi:MAG: M23 family metallopeptidase [Verrucomicrobia bacterium]|nr:MAG: M23 family metallopeptidase [Verrucomicrobiota bacterium]
MKHILSGFLAFTLCFSSAFAETPPPIEVRFCPASAVHTYPLESRRDLQSLMLQNVAVINHGEAPFKIDHIEVELLQSGEVLDSKKLNGNVIQRFAERGAKMQEAGVLKQIAFQFCGNDLIAPSIKLAGPTLNRDQALLVTQQVFAFTGTRESLRVKVDGNSSGKTKEVSGTLPIKSEFAKNTYIFPLRGVSYAGWGASFHTGHRWAIPEEFALDIARLGGDGLSHKGDGSRFEDYYAYGTDVLAACDGTVVEAANDQPEDSTAMQRPDESQEAYFARLQKEQAGRLAKGMTSVTGNYVMIDHGKSEYSFYAHLQPGSVRIHKGDRVKAGDVIGKLGSSGNSTEPHLHFHVCDKADSLMSAGLPVNFSNVTIQWADVPRPIQSGDIVIAK